MRKIKPPTPPDNKERAGPARDFSIFSELELERRRNSDQDFDADLFHEAVTLVLGKIAGLGGREQGDAEDDHQ
ncbi:MAG: hypothetical protein LJE70_08440 [Chromatiaceae bacterium]|jgi:hypothetical protein|nr:hypothetical protein [Chromatiaceae bacterium]